jgi:ribosome maturation factor RimP
VKIESPIGEGAAKSPLLLGITEMINREKLAETIQEHLEGSDKFLVDLKVNPRNNKILVLLDGDTGVSIKDCVKLSRHIESVFDRDQEDYDLEVSSAGIGTPLTMTRQYRLNLGRLIQLQLADDRKIRGKLAEILDNGIRIEPESPKKGKKKKNPDTDPENLITVLFTDILEAKIQPSY